MKTTRLISIVGFAASTVAVLLVACLAGCVPSTEDRLRAEFGIGAKDSIGTNDVRAAILKIIPVGSTEKDVLAVLQQRTATDKFALVSTNTDSIFCRIDFEPRFGMYVQTSYSIQFLLDAKKALKDVQVQKWLTGP